MSAGLQMDAAPDSTGAADGDAFPGSVVIPAKPYSVSFLAARSSTQNESPCPPAPQPENTMVHHLMSEAGVETNLGVCEETFARLDEAVFQDDRWQNFQEFIGDIAKMPDDELRALLREGATAFGFWHPDNAALSALIRQLRQEPTLVSAPLRAWIDHAPAVPREGQGDLGVRTRTMTDKIVRESTAKKRKGGSVEGYQTFASSYEVGCYKLAFGLLVLIISTLYALRVVLVTYPGVMDVFGWPVFVARLGGMGCALWTAILYLTMAKTFIKGLLLYFNRGGALSSLMDAHQEMHIFAGNWVMITGFIHTLGHCVGTVPGVVRYSTTAELRKKINDIIGCANRDTTPGYMGVTFEVLQWPDCPLDKEMNYLDLVFETTFGWTGLLLILLVVLVWYTSTMRSTPGRFELFWYLHQFTIVSWPALLFIHGSNGWLGVGFPLVVFACALPIMLYSLDRIGRALRYYMYAGKAVQIVDCVIRPGHKGGPDGSLTYLKVAKPPHLWSFWSGMYAFICLPEIAPLQWHPFTICSGPDDETVDFLISGVGDWTHALASSCLQALDGSGKLPTIALDGPFAAPMQSALNKELLIAIGAGVGVTPLLSLLSSIVSALERGHRHTKLKLKEAHFFWMTRSADEFLFGRELITKICTHEGLRDKVFLHLHATGTGISGKGASYLFRECIRRQSVVDRGAFQSAFGNGNRPRQMQEGAQIPWCWINGSMKDVMWVNELLITEPRMMRNESSEKVDQGSASVTTSRWAKALAVMRGVTTVAGIDDKGDIVRRNSGSAGAGRERPAGEYPKLMIPVAFGRPDFGAEISAIGKSLPVTDAHVYVCGNQQLVTHMRHVCESCSKHASNAGRKQHFQLHFERFE